MDNEQTFFDKLKKTKKALYIAYVELKKHIDANSNFVLLENKRRYKTTDLAKNLGISRQTASLYINELKSLNAIAEIETPVGWLYVMNPYLTTKSSKIPQRVAEIFDMPLSQRPQRRECKNKV